MSINVNGGANPTSILYNGNNVTEVIYNGTKVWPDESYKVFLWIDGTTAHYSNSKLTTNYNDVTDIVYAYLYQSSVLTSSIKKVIFDNEIIVPEYKIFIGINFFCYDRYNGNIETFEGLEKINFNNQQCSGLFMFQRKLKTIDVSNIRWNTAIGYGNSTFTDCELLESITGLENMVKPSRITQIFNGCYALKSVEGISNWDVTDIGYIKLANCLFSDCKSLTEIDISGWDLTNWEGTLGMFSMCKNLEHIYVGDNWDLSNVTTSTGMFTNCNKLPNFDSKYTDKTKAYVGAGGYLERKS